MERPDIPFPVGGVDLSELEETHNLVRVTPMQQPPLAYSLILPKTWIQESDVGEQPGGVGKLARIGLFADRAAPDATVVQVSFTRLPVEVPLRDWVALQAQQQGIELLRNTPIELAQGPGVDAGGIMRRPDTPPFVVRLLVLPDGGRIFLATAMCPRSRYGEQMEDMTIATHSFKLLNPGGSPRLEQWLEVEVPDPDFTVAMPASWRGRPKEVDAPGKSGTDMLLVREPKEEERGEEPQLMAYLRVKAIERDVAGDPGADDLLFDATEELEAANVQVTSTWEEDDDRGLSHLEDLMDRRIASGTMAGRPVELRSAFVERPPLIFAVTAISVKREAQPLLWMRSKRAYEIAVQTVEPA